MSLSSTEIARIASLARLQLAPEESERMRGQINGFFELVERMCAVDTTGIEPLAHPVAAIQDVTLGLRTTWPANPISANLTSAAHLRRRGFFLVPRIIE